jgi:hypothetical protein
MEEAEMKIPQLLAARCRLVDLASNSVASRVVSEISSLQAAFDAEMQALNQRYMQSFLGFFDELQEVAGEGEVAQVMRDDAVVVFIAAKLPENIASLARQRMAMIFVGSLMEVYGSHFSGECNDCHKAVNDMVFDLHPDKYVMLVGSHVVTIDGPTGKTMDTKGARA